MADNQTAANFTARGWDEPSGLPSSVILAHWLGLLTLFPCTVVLAITTWLSKGPRGTEAHYAGYNEENCIFIYVCLFGTVSYFSKVVADSFGHNFINAGPLLLGIGNYRYADQMITAPLIMLDLSSQLRAPYRISSAVLVYGELLFSLMTQFCDERSLQLYFWFTVGYILKGLGNWFQFVVIMHQYRRLQVLAPSIGAGKSLYLLKIAIFTFFSVWIFYPIMWIMGKEGLVDADGEEICACFLDVLVKLIHGITLMLFRRTFDRKMFALLDRIGMDGDESLRTDATIEAGTRSSMSIPETMQAIQDLRMRLESLNEVNFTRNQSPTVLNSDRSLQPRPRKPRARLRRLQVVPGDGPGDGQSHSRLANQYDQGTETPSDFT